MRGSTLDMLNLGFLWDIQVEMPWTLLHMQVRSSEGRQEVKIYVFRAREKVGSKVLYILI